jgi:hypothetical protein
MKTTRENGEWKPASSGDERSAAVRAASAAAVVARASRPCGPRQKLTGGTPVPLCRERRAAATLCFRGSQRCKFPRIRLADTFFPNGDAGWNEGVLRINLNSIGYEPSPDASLGDGGFRSAKTPTQPGQRFGLINFNVPVLKNGIQRVVYTNIDSMPWRASRLGG